MSIEVLLDKSDNNKHIAQNAEESNFYEVAISRYYYSIYQKITYILRKNTDFIDPEGPAKHVDTDNKFKVYVLDKVPFHELPALQTLGKMKSLQIKADYSDEAIEYTEFNDEFKKVYNIFSEKLDSLL